MNIKLLVKNKDFINIDVFIRTAIDKFIEIFHFFLEDYIKTIQEITKQNKEYISKISECNKLFQDLEYLYTAIPYEELLKNLLLIKDGNNDGFKDNMKFVRTRDYKRLKKFFHREITEDKWNGLYVAWVLCCNIPYQNKDDNFKLLSFIFPEIFKKYPIEDFYIIFNSRECVTNKRKETRRNEVEDYSSDDKENYYWHDNTDSETQEDSSDSEEIE
jgi:hypothetical protein